jgi:rare lipoprotein A
MMRAGALAAIAVFALAACSGSPKKASPPTTTRIDARSAPRTMANTARKSPYARAQEDISKRGNYTRGGLYAPEIQDSAPAGLPDVDLIPEPEVTAESRSHYGNRSPYVVLGKTYSVIDDPSRYEEVGLASFYGNKFHGRRTSNLEVYDMYAFSAASKTLPLPSYARVTNLANGKSVIVRVNDRGPFHEGRIIDLSYAAAVKLGVDRAGTARVEVKGLSAGDDVVSKLATESDDVVAARAALSQPPLLPPGVHIATGKPVLSADERPATASAIDHLLTALPVASANVGERSAQAATPSPAPPAVNLPPAVAPANASQRFDMRQDGRTMSTNEFDAWMRSRHMRVATGKPGMPDKSTSVATQSVQSAAAVTPIARELAAPPTNTQLSPAPTVAGNAVTFQVASFAARANAEHASAMLTGAGIDGVRLLDADANGRKVWRLRVGPVDPGAAQAVVARIQGLGFGQPQRVRE